MTDLYLWLKTFHLISLIVWAGSMFILPWRFVSLTQYQADPDRELLMLKLLQLVIRRILNISMIATFITGAGLIYVLHATGTPIGGWLHAKLTLVLILAACYGMLTGSLRRIIKKGASPRSVRYYSTIGIISMLCVCTIVYLVVFKPF